MMSDKSKADVTYDPFNFSFLVKYSVVSDFSLVFRMSTNPIVKSISLTELFPHSFMGALDCCGYEILRERIQ
jgi:hypothetical protein